MTPDVIDLQKIAGLNAPSKQQNQSADEIIHDVLHAEAKPHREAAGNDREVSERDPEQAKGGKDKQGPEGISNNGLQ